ncbi:MAG TPA: F0F1 ATP synthase subunit B [Coxiellaceae bacterium]|nr:F0F1 ATP synthase subunit B [Coxiellaceae bacterium]
MDINITLLGQMITFAIFVWFTMKFVWPPLMKVMNERKQKIAEGLAAAEEGERKLELADAEYKAHLVEAKNQAAHIIEQANQRARHIVEESKDKAREEGERLMQITDSEIKTAVNHAKEALTKQFATLAIAGAEKILQHNVDEKANEKLLNELIQEI